MTSPNDTDEATSAADAPSDTATVPANQDTANYPTGPEDRDLTEGGTRFPSLDEIAYAEAQARGFSPAANTVTPNEVYAPFAVEGNDTSAYIGVSTEYMTYAEDTNKPFLSQGGVEQDREEAFLGSATPVLVPPVPESQQTLGAGSTDETIYTAVSGEAFVAAQAVTEDSGEPAEGEVVKEENPASPAGAQTETVATPAVDATSPASEEEQADVSVPTPPPVATTGTQVSGADTPTDTGTGTDPAVSPTS